jgi:hypothetical protein
VGKSYYELLELPNTATLEEIKQTFRREIAKYHPDKVQHLGKEFQEIAAVKAADLTQAYKTLSDESRRAEYDALLASGAAAPPREAKPATAPPSPPRPAEPAAAAPPPASSASAFSQDRAASSDLIQKATVQRFRSALEGEFGTYEAVDVPGFQVGCVPKPGFLKLKVPPRVLGCFVPQVDAAAVTTCWTQAGRMKKEEHRDLVVFVMGPAVATAGELAGAIAEQRRKPRPAGGKLILVPVNTRTWQAHVPQDAPPVVKSLIARLKSS